MKSRLWALGACALVLAAIMLLAPSLDDLRFEPARQAARAPDAARTVIIPAFNIPVDTPLWQILLFWLAAVVNLALFVLLLPPELRRRLLRQMLRFMLGVLALVLALRYRLLKLPAFILEGLELGQAGPAIPSVPSEAEVFRAPNVPPWMIYMVTLVLLWLVVLGLYVAYRVWRRYRSRHNPTMWAVADIARSSLADLAAGRQWGDVVVEAYARMTDAVRLSRGLERDSSMTPREFANRLARTGLPTSAVEELTYLFEAVRYGGHAADDGARRRAAACLQSILLACGRAA